MLWGAPGARTIRANSGTSVRSAGASTLTLFAGRGRDQVEVIGVVLSNVHDWIDDMAKVGRETSGTFSS